MKKRYYVAYGSNLNIAQMHWRCPDARPIGTAMLDGYHLLFKGSKTGSYLTIEQKNDGSVPIALWEVSGTDEERLDRYEGFPAFYYKRELQITFTDLKTGPPQTRSCFIYIMHEDRPLGIPRKSYVETCLEGYRNFGFNPLYLKNAFEASWKEAK